METIANVGASGASGDHSSSKNQKLMEIITSAVWRLHKAVAESEPNSNFAFSSSRSGALMMALFAGATGPTLEEFKQILGVAVADGELEVLMEAFPKIVQCELNNNEDSKLDQASEKFASSQRLFYSTGDSLKESYVKLLRTIGCDVQQVDFIASAHAFMRIVHWLDNVGNKIGSNTSPLKDQLKIDALSRLVWVSAVKFEGILDMELAQSQQEAFFDVNATTRVSTKMIGAEVNMKYAVFPRLDARAVAIPFKEGRYALWIFLPKGKQGLSQLEHSLRSYTNAKDMESTFEPTARKLHFYMPEIKIMRNLNFVAAFKLLGAQSVFDINNASFDKLEETSENAHVSAIVENMQLQVLNSASNTADFDIKSKKDPDAMDFHVEHPFCFMIYDEKLQMVAVTGRVVNPLE